MRIAGLTRPLGQIYPDLIYDRHSCISSFTFSAFSSSCMIFDIFGRIIAAQLVETFADGEFIYFGHRNLLCATRRCLPQVSTV